MKKIRQFIGSFLCIASIIMIMCIEFVTKKLAISKFLERDRNGIINNIIIYIFMIVFAVPVLIFMRYLKIE